MAFYIELNSPQVSTEKDASPLRLETPQADTAETGGRAGEEQEEWGEEEEEGGGEGM